MATDAPVSKAEALRSEVLRSQARALELVGESLSRLELALGETASALLLLADELPSDSELLTVEEAAALLRRSIGTVRAKCAAGELRAVKEGTWRIPRAELDAYLRRRRT